MSVIQILGRLVLATVCSAVIGFERESAQKDAGFRTHMLVGVGAAVFTIVSIVGFEGADQSRVAAQIVTGIGFLGAGAIFKEGATVKGLTTAAGLWAVAAVGVAAGTGSVALAVAGTVFVSVVLLGFQRMDRAVRRRRQLSPDQIEVTLDDTKKLESVLEFSARIDPAVEQLSFKRTEGKGGVLIIAVHEHKADMLCEMLAALKGVASADRLPPLFWEHPERS